MSKRSRSTNPTDVSEVKLPLLTVALLIFSGLGWVFSGILHEVGHALAVISAGGHVTSFQPFVWLGPPHIGYTGSFTSIQKAWISVSGAAVVYLIGLVGAAVFPLQKFHSHLRLLFTVLIIPFLAQSISYVILPLFYLSGIAPGDDVIQFIEFSNLSPLLVSGAAALLALLAALIVIRRLRIISVIQTAAAARKENL